MRTYMVPHVPENAGQAIRAAAEDITWWNNLCERADRVDKALDTAKRNREKSRSEANEKAYRDADDNYGACMRVLWPILFGD